MKPVRAFCLTAALLASISTVIVPVTPSYAAPAKAQTVQVFSGSATVSDVQLAALKTKNPKLYAKLVNYNGSGRLSVTPAEGRQLMLMAKENARGVKVAHIGTLLLGLVPIIPSVIMTVNFVVHLRQDSATDVGATAWKAFFTSMACIILTITGAPEAASTCAMVDPASPTSKGTITIVSKAGQS